MNSLLSYCGLVDAKIRASDKDLPVNQILPTLHEIYQNVNSIFFIEILDSYIFVAE